MLRALRDGLSSGASLAHTPYGTRPSSRALPVLLVVGRRHSVGSKGDFLRVGARGQAAKSLLSIHGTLHRWRLPSSPMAKVDLEGFSPKLAWPRSAAVGFLRLTVPLLPDNTFRMRCGPPEAKPIGPGRSPCLRNFLETSSYLVHLGDAPSAAGVISYSCYIFRGRRRALSASQHSEEVGHDEDRGEQGDVGG